MSPFYAIILILWILGFSATWFMRVASVALAKSSYTEEERLYFDSLNKDAILLKYFFIWPFLILTILIKS